MYPEGRGAGLDPCEGVLLKSPSEYAQYWKIHPSIHQVPSPSHMALAARGPEGQVKASFIWQHYFTFLAVLSERSSGKSAPCSLSFPPKSLHL